MRYFDKFVSRVRESQPGQTMTEYVLIIAAIAVPAISRTRVSKVESTRSSPT